MFKRFHLIRPDFFAAFLLSAAALFSSCSSETEGLTGEEIPVYTVTFNVNGGSGTMSDISVPAGTIVTLNSQNLSCSGKMFAAWNTSADGHGTGYADKASLVVTRDMTLYAVWAVPHTLTFDSNGGSGDNYSQQVPENISTRILENAFSKSGYVLAGWNTKPDASGKSYSDRCAATFAEDTTLYAVWKRPCTVVFHTDGGTGIENQVVPEGNMAERPKAPVREGFRFMGWFSDSGHSEPYSFALPVTEDIELFASWKRIITVTYDPNGGTGEIRIQELLEGEEIILLENSFERTDYGFACWNTSRDGEGERYDDKASASPVEDLVLYAQWGKSCILSFNRNSDDAEGEMEGITAPAGSFIPLPACSFSLSGSYCTGWNTGADGSGTKYSNGEKIILSESIVLYAQWKEGSGITYPVKIPESSEHGRVTLSSTSGMAGDFITINTEPDENYKVASISITSASGAAVPYTVVTENEKYQFQLSEEEVTVSVEFVVTGYRVFAAENFENGTFETEKEFYIPGETVTVTIIADENWSYKADSISVKDKEGNDIEVTADSENENIFTFEMAEGGVTLYADFAKNQRKVTFVSNFGANTCDDLPAPLSGDIYSNVTLPSCTYIYYGNGYTFRNWNTKQDGTGTAYNAGDIFTLNEDITLYTQCDASYIIPVEDLATVVAGIKSHNLTSANIIIKNAKTSDLTGTSASSISPVGQQLAKINSSTTVNLTLQSNSNLTAIGNYAFYNLTKLATLSIPSSLTSIGNYAFYYCYNLTGFSIPSSVTGIGDSAFYGCTKFSSSIPGSVTTIGSSAFKNCTGITSLSIPSGVTTIGSSAFESCTSLTSVSIPGKVTTIASKAFYGCSKLSSVSISSGVTSIGESAFESCSSLKNITIPNTVTALGDKSFKACPLSSITFTSTSKVTSIGDSAFSGCNFTSFTFPQSVTSIGACALYNNTYLTSVAFGINLKSIGYSAFEGCSKLTSVTIPDSVTSLGTKLFAGCGNLTELTFPFLGKYTSSSPLKLGEFFGDNYSYNCEAVEQFSNWDNYTAGSGTTYYIPKKLEKVTVKKGIIANGAFSNCKNLKYILLGDGVTNIYDSAFAGCDSLSTPGYTNCFVIPNSVTSIGKSAFGGCSFGELRLPSLKNNFGYYFGSKDPGKYFYSAQQGATTYYIPLYLATIVINSLSDASYNSSNKKVPDYAFENCRKLSTITLPSVNIEIGKRAFAGISDYPVQTLLTTKKVIKIGDYAFKGNLAKKIEVPDSVTEIGEGAFNDCISLTEISVPFTGKTSADTTYPFGIIFGKEGSDSDSNTYKVEQKSSYTYYLPVSLNIINVTGGTSIKSYAFRNIKVSEINIPGTTASIGSHAFDGCTLLSKSNFSSGSKDFNLPSSLTTIYEYAFNGCKLIRSIEFNASLNRIDIAAFKGVPMTDYKWLCTGGTWVEASDRYKGSKDYDSNVETLTKDKNPKKYFYDKQWGDTKYVWRN